MQDFSYNIFFLNFNEGYILKILPFKIASIFGHPGTEKNNDI